ncbi:hypothetical protein ACGFZA_31675 [Streptomyces sp. NPDC048211]|uniref:hypothetical protein n=1 Tax=Streptomyces sp. NPDC048211 TaxID=3365516 RepID=UPI0037126984
MAALGYASLPVPDGGDAPVGPAAMAALANAVDPHLIQHVANQAERDTTFAAAPLHTLVTAEDGSLWIKTSAADGNVWATIYQPLPAWRPITLASGYQSGEFTPQARVIGRQVSLRGRIQRADGTTFAMAGVKVGDVPDDCRPALFGSFAGGASLQGDPMTGVGRFEVLGDASASSLGGSGSLIWYSQDGTQESGGGVAWIDISGSYWLD